MNTYFVIKLVISELRRFCRKGLMLSVCVPLGVGFLTQISVPGIMNNGEILFDKRAFYCIIFCFWLGITNSARRIVEDRRSISRLRSSGASAWSILLAKVHVVVLAALLHSFCFYIMFLFNILDLSPDSRISANLNEQIYGHKNLVSWMDYNSDFHKINDDPMGTRDLKYDGKTSLGQSYEAGLSKSHRLFYASDESSSFGFTFKNHLPLLFTFFMSSACAGVMGLFISSIFKDGQSDRALLCVPFVTAFQILFAKISIGSSAALFGQISEVFSVMDWWGANHVVSLFTCTRYLVVLSQHESVLNAFLSPDAIVIYIFMVFFSCLTWLNLKKLNVH